MIESIVPLPTWNDGGFLPPQLPPSPYSSPYLISLTQLIERFATTPPRRDLLSGFLRLRKDLRALGFERGFHWIGGSFVEDVERLDGRPPNDIDLVSFLHPPMEASSPMAFERYKALHPAFFDRHLPKQIYRCDAFIVPFLPDPQGSLAEGLVSQVTHWLTLFGHERRTHQVKGILHVDFESPDSDEAAQALLARMSQATDAPASELQPLSSPSGNRMAGDSEPNGQLFVDGRWIPCANPRSVSDGHHTFRELYEHRNLLFIHLCLAHPQQSAWKRVEDQSFILYLQLPSGQISYHLPKLMLPLVQGRIPQQDDMAWDGHTAQVVLERLAELAT